MASLTGLYFKKDKKAQIYKIVSGGTDSEGYAIERGLYPIAPAPIWCYTSQLSQSDIMAASAYGQEETRLFVFNFYKNITVYDIILYKDTWYEVTRVDHKDDYNGETFIYVKNCPRGKIGDIKTYDPSKWE
jgi:SPP1 family predicted phage head-tail adaptor